MYVGFCNLEAPHLFYHCGSLRNVLVETYCSILRYVCCPPNVEQAVPPAMLAHSAGGDRFVTRTIAVLIVNFMKLDVAK